MSYCRFGDDSDVYMFPSNDGIVCWACSMIAKDTAIIFKDKIAAYLHLLSHKDYDDKVPDYAIRDLKVEIKNE